ISPSRLPPAVCRRVADIATRGIETPPATLAPSTPALDRHRRPVPARNGFVHAADDGTTRRAVGSLRRLGGRTSGGRGAIGAAVELDAHATLLRGARRGHIAEEGADRRDDCQG